MIIVAERRAQQFQMAGYVPSPVLTEGWSAQDEVEVFNKVASVERRLQARAAHIRLDGARRAVLVAKEALENP
jgi:hypothetical protein